MRERMSSLVFLDWFEMLVLGAFAGERGKASFEFLQGLHVVLAFGSEGGQGFGDLLGRAGAVAPDLVGHAVVEQVVLDVLAPA